MNVSIYDTVFINSNKWNRLQKFHACHITIYKHAHIPLQTRWGDWAMKMTKVAVTKSCSWYFQFPSDLVISNLHCKARVTFALNLIIVCGEDTAHITTWKQNYRLKCHLRNKPVTSKFASEQIMKIIQLCWCV